MRTKRRFGQWGIVVGPPGVTKWSGVRAYCEREGIDRTEVLAVGDGDNDVAMLQQGLTDAVAISGFDRDDDRLRRDAGAHGLPHSAVHFVAACGRSGGRRTRRNGHERHRGQ